MSMYKQLIKDNISKSDIIEIFVDYYGENNRELIAKRINEVNVAFDVVNEVEYIVNNSIKEKYGKRTDVAWQSVAQDIMLVLNNLAENKPLTIEKNGKVYNGENFLAREANVLKELGINPKRILKRNERNEFEIIPGAELDKLKAYVRLLEQPKSKNSTLLENRNILERICKEYNFSAETKKFYDKNELFIRDGNVQPLEENPKVVKDYGEREFPKISENLTEEDIKFFNDLILSASSPNDWNEDFSKYYLNGINRIFNKNYTTLEEIGDDLSLFFDFINREKVNVEEEFNRNRVFISLNGYNKKGTDIFSLKDFVDKSRAIAMYKGKDDSIFLRISGNEKVPLSPILHELL